MLNHIHQVAVHPTIGFHFQMPKDDCFGYTVHINGEYKLLQNDKLLANIWANIDNRPISYFICNKEVPLPKSREQSKLIGEIVRALNADEDFYAELDKCINTHTLLMELLKGDTEDA